MREFIINLAKKAGDVLLGYFKSDQKLIALRSGAKDAATEYDKLVDKLIIEEIRKNYPNHSFLTEESGCRSADPDWLWIIDSLDGTGNFANQNPFFSVCIALVHKGDLFLGVIYAPAINEFYFAEKGKGAYLNEKQIRVSKINSLQGSYIFYCEGGERDRKRTRKILNKIYPGVTDIRKLGSAGLETAWVAAGRGEAYFTTKIEAWDVAPGVLLVSEAGGYVTDFKGRPWRSERSDLVFSNKRIHPEILRLVKDL